jgi:hypothetical protein
MKIQILSSTPNSSAASYSSPLSASSSSSNSSSYYSDDYNDIERDAIDKGNKPKIIL